MLVSDRGLINVKGRQDPVRLYEVPERVPDPVRRAARSTRPSGVVIADLLEKGRHRAAASGRAALCARTGAVESTSVVVDRTSILELRTSVLVLGSGARVPRTV